MELIGSLYRNLVYCNLSTSKPRLVRSNPTAASVDSPKSSNIIFDALEVCLST